MLGGLLIRLAPIGIPAKVGRVADDDEDKVGCCHFWLVIYGSDGCLAWSSSSSKSGESTPLSWASFLLFTAQFVSPGPLILASGR